MLVICLSITATLIERWYVASREDLFVCAFMCVFWQWPFFMQHSYPPRGLRPLVPADFTASDGTSQFSTVLVSF